MGVVSPMASMTSYKNVRIWDGESGTYRPETALTIQSDRIVAIGEDDPQARDCSGLTVLPGLIDSHVHMVLDPAIHDVEKQLAQSDDDIRKKMPERAASMVKAGITCARDLGGGNWLELELRDRIRTGEIHGPRLVCAGRPITSIEGHCHFWGGAVACTEDAHKVVDENCKKGVDLIKIMATGGMFTAKSHPGRAQFSQDEMTEIISYAHDRDFAVAAHCHGSEGIANAVYAGVDTVEHCSWMDKDGRRGEYLHDVVIEMASRKTWVSPTVNANWSRFMQFNPSHLGVIRQQFREMKAAGVKFIASTDAGIPNVRHHDLPRALPVFAQYADMQPVDVLRTATSSAARALNIHNETGTIEVGLAADLLFVEGDPLKDLDVLQKPVCVVAHGVEVQS